LRGPPQMPISSAIGISIASQKTKNSTRSSAQNTPTMAVSIISRQIMNSLMRVLM